MDKKGNSLLITNSREVTISKTRKILSYFFSEKIIIKLKSIKNILNFFALNMYDSKQFIKSMNNRSNDKLLHNVVINTHILEKGLSHENIRLNFGKNALKNLSENLNEFGIRHLTETEEYRYAVSVLAAYIQTHVKIDGNRPKILETFFSSDVLKDVDNRIENSKDLELGGVFEITKESKLSNREVNFKTLAMNRYSIRNFCNEKVNMNLVIEAVKIAQKSPSACNRQASRVVVIKNVELIKKVLDIQGGLRGYQLPSVLIVNAVDLSAYSSYTDRHMGYVDPGLFTMSIVYGLEFVGLGACLLNASFNQSKEKKIRSLISLEENYQFTSLIAVGVIPEQTKVAKSHRLDTDEIMKVIM